MAKSKEEGEKGTRQVRVNEDVGEMLSWIIRIEGGTTATLLDPMIRAQVTARYKKHEEKINKLRAAQAALDQVEREIKELAAGATPDGAEEKPRKKKGE